MTSKQEAKLNMYNAVIAFCNQNEITVAEIPAFVTALENLAAKKSQIDDTAQQEAIIITGITINKANLKSTMVASATSIASAGFAYATSVNNPVLKEKFKFTSSDFQRFKDDELPLIVQNIHDNANSVAAQLVAFGITAPMITAFQTQITNFSNAVPSPRNAAAQRKALRELLVTYFKEADLILKEQMDKLALQYKTSDPEFYNSYRNNRIIVNAPTSASQAAGIIKLLNADAVIAGVAVTVTGQPYNTTSGVDGSYSLKIPVPGLYTINFTKAGYQPLQSPNILIKLGETTTLNVELTPA
jgi:Carboxypeptidase regulatory-like domain